MKATVIALLFVISPAMGANKPSWGCNRDILESYGLFGVSELSNIKLEMCPTIEYSCCAKQDQLAMYSNWVHNNEHKNVKAQFNEFTRNYEDLLKTLVKVSKIAADVKKALTLKKVANCKILAERVLVFQIEKIQEKIRENLDGMQEFFEDTYQGFYCSICDLENHRYFDIKKREIFFSEKFCRDIVQKTLPVLLFFHVQVVKYFNLVSKFLESCDHKGDYRLDAEVKKEHLFSVMPDVKQTLSQCRNFRNHKSWFVYCKDVCDNFRITEFNEFFEPQAEVVIDYNNYLEGLIQRYNKELTLAPKEDNGVAGKAAKSSKKHKVRLLVEDKPNNENPNLIFRSGLNSKVKLDSFKSNFQEEGISMFDDGRNSLINTEMFNQIKTTIHLTTPQSASAYTGTVARAPDGTIVSAAEAAKMNGQPPPSTAKPVTSSSGAKLSSTEEKMLKQAGKSGAQVLLAALLFFAALFV